jgi:flagellar biosynthesis protein FlhG
MVVSGLFSPERLAVVHQRIEEAYDTLLDPDRRRQHDLKLFPDGIPARPTPTPAQGVPPPSKDRPSGANERIDETPVKVELPPAPEIAPDTEFTGTLLRQLREARSIELLEISQRTKIAIGHLRAIEDERWEAMPATVYLRGFLVEYARFLRLDVNQVTRTFLTRAGRKQRE